jgi:hypothetical protein
LQPEKIRPPLLLAAQHITATLGASAPASASASATDDAARQKAEQQSARQSSQQPTAAPALVSEPAALSDPIGDDLSGWLLRRLDLASGIAAKLRADADQVQQLLGQQHTLGDDDPKK